MEDDTLAEAELDTGEEPMTGAQIAAALQLSNIRASFCVIVRRASVIYRQRGIKSMDAWIESIKLAKKELDPMDNVWCEPEEEEEVVSGEPF